MLQYVTGWEKAPLLVTLTPPATGASPATGNFKSDPALFNGVPLAPITFSGAVSISAFSSAKSNPWLLTMPPSNLVAGLQGALVANSQNEYFLNPEVIDDVFFVCQYSAG
jgi:hypothetical protein